MLKQVNQQLLKNPTFIVDNVVHYCVANMPGGVPRTSTMALNKATLPLLEKIADQGYQKTLRENKNYLAGLNIFKGKITCKGVSDAFDLNYHKAESIFNPFRTNIHLFSSLTTPK